jgi:hypothetical protein
MEINSSEYDRLKKILLEYASFQDEMHEINLRERLIRQQMAAIKREIYPIAVCAESVVQLDGQVALISGDEDGVEIRFISQIRLV